MPLGYQVADLFRQGGGERPGGGDLRLDVSGVEGGELLGLGPGGEFGVLF